MFLPFSPSCTPVLARAPQDCAEGLMLEGSPGTGRGPKSCLMKGCPSLVRELVHRPSAGLPLPHSCRDRPERVCACCVLRPMVDLGLYSSCEAGKPATQPLGPQSCVLRGTVSSRSQVVTARRVPWACHEVWQHRGIRGLCWEPLVVSSPCRAGRA